MDRQDPRTIIARRESAAMMGAWARYLSLGSRWAVRLFLAIFVAIVLTIWSNLLFDPVVSEHLIGSKHACAIHYGYCSWSTYVLAELVPSTLLAGAAIVALAWRRLRRREVILSALALLGLVYLGWWTIQVQSAS